jgi:prepilin-type N-terminal cleavage/methylation domain-containing protein
MRVFHPANCGGFQRGFSLVELMIALALGLVLSFGAVTLFLQSKTSYLQDEETARMQENGRWALRYLAREVSMAGFMGGLLDGSSVNSALVVADDCATGWALQAGVAIEHLDNATPTSAAAAYGCLTGENVSAGSDVFALRRVKDAPHVYDGGSNGVLSDKTVYLRVQEYGADASLVRATTTAITSADLTPGSEVDVWEYQPQLLFVRDFSLSSGDGIPTLCRKVLTTDEATLAVGDTQCLIEGIEDLQLEFGIDDGSPLDQVPDYYVSAPTPAELSSAVTARIYVLSRSINEVNGYTNDKSYQLGTKTIAAANDGHYRRVLQTTVMLRNSEIFGF